MNVRDELAVILTRNTTTCLDSALVGSEYLARDIAEAVLAAGYVKMPSREALRGALSNVLCNAKNYPPAVQTRVLGQDMTPLLDGTADAILALLAGETS